ncbi:PREDICTED: cytochrome P450 94B3-like [Nelumbo nucifera]|uniref:Cytochrome P450 94B3-like n=2 Tax=Nelumbo nucifera TaxID=4432 RepID=A0A1U7ZB49_NELNU|nr:PREDICTED: cytochrome P450 94B3-like [Nelumbo nucifera]DAD34271.1 TPA_asm: hypothetical protein HUJ06_004911 [Nelumbo nucifera]
MPAPVLTADPPTLLITSILLFLLHWFLCRFRRLCKFSGDGLPTYPLIGCLISFYKNRRRLLDWYTDLLADSPMQTIVIRRFGARRTVVTANPDNVEYILTTNFNNFPKGQPFTDILGDLLGCGIFNVDGELWRAQRKLASHEFSTKSLREFVGKTLNQVVKNRLTPVLASAMETDQIVDLQDLLRRFAFDTVCMVSLGIDPGCLDSSLPVSALAGAFDIASEISARRASAPVFAVWKIKRALCLGSERRLKEAIQHVHGSVEEIIRDKKKLMLNRVRKEEINNNNSNGDLLSRLISSGYDDEVIRDMVISFIMAGRDTASAAMTWLFWLLSCHPHIENEVVKEVEAINTGDSPLDYEALKELPLLKACLCESMRLYPPIAWDSKHVVEDDTLPDGTRVRAGDRVTYFPYGMGRMEGLWGKDRFEFKPDRWFVEPDKEGGALKEVSPFKFPVFQAGPRVCLGKEMAFVQMKYVMASLLKQFQFKSVGLEEPAFVPLLTAHMAGGLNVLIRPRGRHSI